jgi:hypothetical protein
LLFFRTCEGPAEVYLSFNETFFFTFHQELLCASTTLRRCADLILLLPFLVALFFLYSFILQHCGLHWLDALLAQKAEKQRLSSFLPSFLWFLSQRAAYMHIYRFAFPRRIVALLFFPDYF